MPYTVRGNDVPVDTEPFLHNNKNYVPLRELVGALGGSVNFDNETKTATATIDPWVATVNDGDQTVEMTNGEKTVPVKLTAPPLLQDNVLYVPFDFFKDAFGYDVTFNAGHVTIVNPLENA